LPQLRVADLVRVHLPIAKRFLNPNNGFP
jgi:hypothetical protein